MILSEIRDTVRLTLDLPEEDDLPTALLDLYIAEGYQHVINREDRWPFFAQEWTVTSNADGTPITAPATLSRIDAVTYQGKSLTYVAHVDAAAYFQSDTGTPEVFSTYGDLIYLWPTPTEAVDYTIRGWRKGDDSWVGTAGNEPDTGTERRLDRSLVHYAVYRVYSQQEDPALAEEWRMSFERIVNAAIDAILRPKYRGRVLMGSGHLVSTVRRPRAYLEIDTG